MSYVHAKIKPPDGPELLIVLELLFFDASAAAAGSTASTSMVMSFVVVFIFFLCLLVCQCCFDLEFEAGGGQMIGATKDSSKSRWSPAASIAPFAGHH